MKPLPQSATMSVDRLPHFVALQPVHLDSTGAYVPDAWLGDDQGFAASCVNERKWQVTGCERLETRDPDYSHIVTLWGPNGEWQAFALAASFSMYSARILADVDAEDGIDFCFSSLTGSDWEYTPTAPHGLPHEARTNCLRYLSVYELDDGRIAIGYNLGGQSERARDRLSPSVRRQLKGARLVRQVDLQTNTDVDLDPARA